MVTAVAIAMGLLAIAAITAWSLAVRVSSRIERLRNPGEARPVRAYANLFTTAFGPKASATDVAILQPQLRIRLVTALACILAMAVLSFALPLLPRETSADQPPVAPAADVFHSVGSTLIYVRSNQDGSQPETIIVHIAAPDEIHVAKMVSRCTDAAYVTAKFGDDGEAIRLVGGRLEKDSTQSPQIYLDFDAPARRFEIRLGKPEAKPVEAHDAPPAPWRMYDFDLAEFALFGPREHKDFSFGLAMARTENAPPLLDILGEAEAKFLYSSEGGARNHFRISGPAFTDPQRGDRGGEFITDATYGHIIEARLGRPNHAGYRNFMLKLDSATSGAAGEDVWRNALAAHWKDCPA